MMFLMARFVRGPNTVDARVSPAVEIDNGPALVLPPQVEERSGVPSDTVEEEDGPVQVVPMEPHGVDISVEEQEKEFKWLRETTDVGELKAEFQELTSQLNALAFPIAFQRLADGEYEPVKTLEDGSIPIATDRAHFVDVFTKGPDGKPVKIILPEAKYPEVYDLKRRTMWLDELIRSRK